MPSELEELTGFMANPNPQIRKIALENLVPYSTAEPTVFKINNLEPIKHLKNLILDHPKIADHVLTILVNLSGDQAVLENLASDDKFLSAVFRHIINPEEPNANVLAMLLANLVKNDSLKTILQRKQPAPEELRTDDTILNQLVDLFVRGQDGAYNKGADYDYLAYVFADLSKHDDVRRYFLEPQPYDGVVPLSKLKVFTEHRSDIRRKGVASTIKNVAFEVGAHPALLDHESDVGILPYVLLPITGSEEYDVDDTMDMLPDLQLLPPDKQRDPDSANIVTHLETLMLLTTTRQGRDHLRQIKVYPIVRETHAHVDDADVKEACDRFVQVIMRDEEDTEKKDGDSAAVPDERVKEVDEEDELVEV
ncbi:protein of unknown function (DUF383) [Geosmithia morbida]|uniref:Protein HGH1 homolog n=1 Tax=Geosmithia morbida TaxID=1094350 RepID=A0A9P5D4W0_9HYPO|nr:protein of unknown function (DUF383) [Geosmithia morbida]KAF4126527.1 protein of unknown function (DUF383) [Geosmithia morbida]